jgi:hypothetical protein
LRTVHPEVGKEGAAEVALDASAVWIDDKAARRRKVSHAYALAAAVVVRKHATLARLLEH